MQDNSISIASSAMLVELSISTWTARKLDKKVSTQVDLDQNAKTRAGNYNKNLLAGTGFLDSITKYAATQVVTTSTSTELQVYGAELPLTPQEAGNTIPLPKN